MKKLFAYIAMFSMVIAPTLGAMPKSAQAISPTWNVVGAYVINVNLSATDYPENLVLAGTNAALTGTLDLVTPPGASPWTITYGSVVGDVINFGGFFNSSPSLTTDFAGTIANDGSMSGTWGDLAGGSRTGTWKTTSGVAKPVVISSTVVVRQADAHGWIFNPDPSTSTSYEFNSDKHSIGAGSLYVKPIGTNPSDKLIALKPLGIPVSSLNSIAYDFQIAGSGVVADAQQYYLNVYVSLPTPGVFYDCRFDYVPSTGSTSAFTTASFNSTDTPANVSDRYTGSPRPDDGYNCPSTLAGMVAGSTISNIALNVGDTSGSDTGLAGYLDKVVISTTSDATTYDFEPTPVACNETASQTLVSDTTTMVDLHGAVAVVPHPAWTSIPGATWIYSEALNANGSSPSGDKVFTKTFTLAGTPADSSLQIAADNMYSVVVNGHSLATGTSATDLNNFSSAATWTIPAADLVSGLNTVTITVTNPAVNPADNTPFGDPNPAGLLYKLTVKNNECVTPVVPGSLTVTKNTIGGDGTFAFTGVSDGFSITTVANTGSKIISNLAPGSYTVAETAQTGWNITSNTCTTITVVSGQTATCTITNTKQSSISGMKFNDKNKNGKLDTGEVGLSGWTIRLIKEDPITDKGTLVTSVVTDVNGNYTFTNVVPGTYEVRETHQKGWKRQTKNPKDMVIVAGTVITDVNFGNAQKQKKEDEDSDRDDNRKDQDGKFFGNHGKSSYEKEQGNKDHEKSDGRKDH